MDIKTKNNNKSGGGKNIVLCVSIVVAIVAVAALITVCVIVLGGSKPKRKVLVNEDNVNKVVENMVDKGKDFVPMGSYSAKMNSTWNFADGKSPSKNAYVENVTSNTHDVYFDVVRSDTNETIYESPVLPRGSYLENIVLDKELEAGTYDCVLTYHLVDEKQNTVSTLNMAITIIVEK